MFKVLISAISLFLLSFSIFMPSYAAGTNVNTDGFQFKVDQNGISIGNQNYDRYDDDDDDDYDDNDDDDY